MEKPFIWSSILNECKEDACRPKHTTDSLSVFIDNLE